MNWKEPKFALYVVGGLVLLMGLWGLAAYFVESLAFGLVVDYWWHSAAKVVLGAYAVWVASQA
jgi:hypothetical protein